MPRDWPTEWPPRRIAEAVRTNAVHYLELSYPVRLAVFEGIEPIQPRTIIEVAGYVLVEAESEPDNWYMGTLRPDGVIECWGQYGDLEETLKSL